MSEGGRECRKKNSAERRIVRPTLAWPALSLSRSLRPCRAEQREGVREEASCTTRACTCACVTHSLSAAADFEMRNEDNSPPQRRTKTAAAGVIFSPSQHDCQCPDWRPTDRPTEGGGTKANFKKVPRQGVDAAAAT